MRDHLAIAYVLGQGKWQRAEIGLDTDTYILNKDTMAKGTGGTGNNGAAGPVPFERHSLGVTATAVTAAKNTAPSMRLRHSPSGDRSKTNAQRSAACHRSVWLAAPDNCSSVSSTKDRNGAIVHGRTTVRRKEPGTRRATSGCTRSCGNGAYGPVLGIVQKSALLRSHGLYS